MARIGRFPNLQRTLFQTFGPDPEEEEKKKRGGIGGFLSGVSETARGVFQSRFLFGGHDPSFLKEPEDLKFTVDPLAEQIRMYAMSIGLDQLTASIAEQMKAGQPITPDQLDALTQGTAFIGSLYSGEADIGTSAALDVLSFITSATEGDYSSTSFMMGLAKLGTTLPTATDVAEEEDALNKNFMEQQTLMLEEQRIKTFTARREYERQGILSVIQLLPSANRLQFMSAMFQTPRFAQLFFGSLDDGYNDGPYVGGVLGSLGGGGSAGPALPPGLSKNAVVAGTRY